MIVAPEQLQQAREYVAQHKNINWYSDPYKLDEGAIVEGVLNYGTWEDFHTLLNIFGAATVGELYKLNTLNRTRINYHPLVKNYFDYYFGIKNPHGYANAS